MDKDLLVIRRDELVKLMETAKTDMDRKILDIRQRLLSKSIEMIEIKTGGQTLF